MGNLRFLTIALILVFGSCYSVLAQRRAANANRTIVVRRGELLTDVAARANITAIELAAANSLTINTRLRKGQRLFIPTSTPSSDTPSREYGEITGKRIIFADGGSLDVDDVWKQGDATWFRLNGTSQSSNKTIRAIEDRVKQSPTTSAASTTVVAKKTEPTTLALWIYFVDGARLRVDEVREVSDGAWYNCNNLSIFVARDRISRIEREQTSGQGSQHGWSSGNLLIDDSIRRSAARFGVDPYLVFLVAEQESHFRPRALSPKGAQGLMQLMPGTARRFGVRKPFDPAENIRGGTQYLKELLTMFGGRVDLALASYNAGEGRVLDYGNRVPPFKETREYVRRISARYAKKNPVEAAASQ